SNGRRRQLAPGRGGVKPVGARVPPSPCARGHERRPTSEPLHGPGLHRQAREQGVTKAGALSLRIDNTLDYVDSQSTEIISQQ
ncbi:hypothetical protein Q604_UNBC12987G0001, partial [human gut metagenome]